MKELVLYIHGANGSPAECEHYRPLFPQADVIGLDYQAFTPWEAGEEIHAAVQKLKAEYDSVILIANSVGAFFTMNADIDTMISRTYFISPIADMESLILNMMRFAGVNEQDLEREGVIHTSFGEDLSWNYLTYVREHPLKWNAETFILYGENDNMTSYESITRFAREHDAHLCVMENGEHWFHTEEQMRFLDEWILSSR